MLISTTKTQEMVEKIKFSKQSHDTFFVIIIKVNCAGQTREAEKIVMHENYNTGGAFANDIALIKLDEPFWINNVRKLFLIWSPYIFL